VRQARITAQRGTEKVEIVAPVFNGSVSIDDGAPMLLTGLSLLFVGTDEYELTEAELQKALAGYRNVQQLQGEGHPFIVLAHGTQIINLQIEEVPLGAEATVLRIRRLEPLEPSA
jgi:hypothetical protein